MAPQTAPNVYHSGVGPIHPHYYPEFYPQPGYPSQTPTNYPGYPPQSPPNYPGYPPQSSPIYPGYPPQSPPNLGPYGAAPMPPPFNPFNQTCPPAAPMQPPFNPGCPPAYSPYPTPPNYPGGQPNNGNTQPGQPQNPPHYWYFLHIGCTTGLNWKKIAQLGFLIYRAIYFYFCPLYAWRSYSYLEILFW